MSGLSSRPLRLQSWIPPSFAWTTAPDVFCIDVPLGDGRVLLFATNPCYRWQNLGEFNMLFNAILHWNDFGKQ